jgi:hypothetical protein
MDTMNECEIWPGFKRNSGYGVKIVNYRPTSAHKWTWEQFNGPVPEGMVLDHICHTEAVKNKECEGGFDCKHRGCVNLDHLELVTFSENVRRGMHSIDNKTTCKKGHDYTDPNNIMVRKSGKRECAQCNRDRANAFWHNRKKEAA